MTNQKSARNLWITTIVLVALAAIQLILGALVLPLHSRALGEIHGAAGWIALLATLAAVYFAAQVVKSDASLKGILYHSISLPALEIINIVLIKIAASAHSMPLVWVHIVVGVAYVAAVVALFFILRKRLPQSARR